jgi:hypothetical protein
VNIESIGDSPRQRAVDKYPANMGRLGGCPRACHRPITPDGARGIRIADPTVESELKVESR